MNRFLSASLVPLLAVTAAIADDVALSGTVTCGGAAVSGVRVTVKNHPDLYALTDASGAFSIGGALPVTTVRSGNVTDALPYVSGSTLHVPVTAIGTKVTMNLFTLSGARIASSSHIVKSSGDCTVPVVKTAAGMRCMVLTVGSARYTIMIPAGLGNVTMHSSRVSGSTSRTAATSIADSLFLFGRGYRSTLVALTGYQQSGIACTITASNPWQPQGALTHDKGMVKILAAGYDFEMGQNEEYTVADEDYYGEQPVHTVSFTGDFWMDTTEVTQKEYDAVMKKYYPDYVVPTLRTSVFGIGDAIPAYYFYWDEAVLFCNAKSKEDGLDTVYSYGEIDGTPGMLCSFTTDVAVTADFTKNGYRLPTEAEWEYACRGGTFTDYYWGKNVADYLSTGIDTAEIGTYAVWEVTSGSKSKGSDGFGIHTVASGLPNAYGLYDMAGNLSEFVHDEESFSYTYGAQTDPSGPSTGSPTHMVRGGNWMNGYLYLRSAARNLRYGEYPFYCVGFRTIRRAE